MTEIAVDAIIDVSRRFADASCLQPSLLAQIALAFVIDLVGYHL